MTWTWGFGDRVRALPPACFAPVMATGIVSRALGIDGAGRLSWALFGLGVAWFVVLAAALAWRAAAHRPQLLADVAAPAKVFGFFTFVAGAEVLAARLAIEGVRAAALVLCLVAMVAWARLALWVPGTLRRSPGALGLADGTWFLCAVGLQSTVVAGSALWHGEAAAGLLLAVWVAGGCLYGAVLGVIGWRLRRHPVPPQGLTPAYWVAMGACAITILAGAQVVQLGWSTGPHRALVATLLVLWGWATLLFPVLLWAGYWRHLRHRVPLRYEPTQWCIVFPLGMYAVASHTLAEAGDVAGLRTVGEVMGWVAGGAWLLVTAAMTGVTRRFTRRRPPTALSSLGSGQNQL
ncbi:tellurite resistance/C4-dicarboxylate transporter family protein [Streptomyces sp. HSW2009]|uniref:tellurite resistance/C4-dicarboxylate transporter family protein n=1 Tax=Streptomyces sp. HSW2009 TaxID=3142890 RepID=UPI0032EE4072